MLDKNIKLRINTARQILVGKVPDPKAQVEQITNALIYKFMDDMDRSNEELGGKAQFLSGELKEFAWGRLMSRELSGIERWDLYTRALATFSKTKQIPELFRSIFKDAYLPYRDPETLNLFLKEIHEFSYDNSENLGNAYEYLLSILGSQGDAGQFRTPRHIIDFIVECVGPKKTDRILDPACGTAGFLISSFKHIWRENSSNYNPETYIPSFSETKNTDSFTVEIQQDGKFKGDKLTPDDKKKLVKNIEGYDISPDMVRLSLVNMYLHNFPEPKIVEYDTLTYEDRWDDDFNVILANPPFMTPKGGIRPHRRFSVSANRAEVLFVDYIAEHLTVNGKAGIIVPEGIIFQTATAYKALRKMIIENNYLYAVVSLPAGVFQPYSGVKTSVLLFDRELAKRNKEILFVKVENDGFDLGAQRRHIDKNDLTKAYEIIRKWQKGEKEESPIALWVGKSKLAKNGEYNLTSDRYRETLDYSNVKWPVVDLGEICEVIAGQSPKGEFYNTIGEGLPFYQGKTEFTDRYIGDPKKWTLQTTKLAYKNDILMSVRAPVGPVNLASGKICIGRGLAAIRVTEKIHYEYLFSLLRVMQDTIKGNGGAVFDSISRVDIERIKIPLPPLEVQKDIVEELDGYQKIIDGARQVVDNWKPHIKIDPECDISDLGTMCDIRTGKLNANAAVDNGQYPFFTCSKEVFRINNYAFDCMAILLSGNNASANYDVKIYDGKFNAYQRTYVITVKENQMSMLLYPFLKNIIEQQLSFLKKQSIGGLTKYLTLPVVKSIKVPIPSVDVQNKIVSEIEAEQQIVDNNKALIDRYEHKIKDKIAEVWGE